MDIHMKKKMTELIQVQLHLVKGIIVVLQGASNFSLKIMVKEKSKEMLKTK